MSDAESAGLYVHVPFCRFKCPYCDFYSVTSRSFIPVWLDSRELGTRMASSAEFDGTIRVSGETA